MKMKAKKFLNNFLVPSVFVKKTKQKRGFLTLKTTNINPKILSQYSNFILDSKSEKQAKSPRDINM